MSGSLRLNELYLNHPDGPKRLLPPCGREIWPEGYAPALSRAGALAVNLYVAVDGDNANDGLSEETPLATLYEAILRSYEFANRVNIYLGAGDIPLGFPAQQTDILAAANNLDFYSPDRALTIIGKGKALTTIKPGDVITLFMVRGSGFLYLKDLTLETAFWVEEASAAVLDGVDIKSKATYPLYVLRNSQVAIQQGCSFQSANHSYASLLLITDNSQVIMQHAVNLTVSPSVQYGIQVDTNSTLVMRSTSLSQLTFSGTFTNKFWVRNEGLVYTDGVALPTSSTVDTASGGRVVSS